ncbi:PQQ-binding-like beta-propeller repeat protein [Terriglobus roseus]|uniref:Quinoprotein glucose dehydrogenase n=1 Tax=Terriglobus roseus TaxID=392734 RepID=A0A1H4NYL2_9BACT|nr:PQQ-binding-like beta-propeller repeat protein [Terriglobus roseus]SEC00249.1 quinoprotein glucose dehydrogenase [Terriglobus roseus]
MESRYLVSIGTAAVCLSTLSAGAQANWASYGQDQGSSRFSTLNQINASNVSKLERAWTFHTGGDSQNEVTPVVMDSVVYLSSPNGYFAVDAVTGDQIWKFAATDTTTRGVTYWPGDKTTAPRIIGAVSGGRIVALDIKTGKPVPEFGDGGYVDIKTKMTSPPAIYKGMLILPTMDKFVRAWDAKTGKMVWSFNLVPQPGEPGHETWENDAWKTTGGVNVWGYITVDEKLGIAFVPTAPPSPDYVGVTRPGDTLYGTSLVALDANTGKLKWFRQLVHHDLWDFDSAAAPALVEVKQKGKTIPAVVHMGKTGLMYFFDRRDGTPIFGMEERPVPQSNVPGEKSSPTQPFPIKPEPIARISMTHDELPKNITGSLTTYCEGLWQKYKLQDAKPFNAWLLNQDVVEFPGAVGGGNWNGVSYNPQLGLVYTNVMNAGQWGHIGLGGGRFGRAPGAGGPGGPPRGAGAPPQPSGTPQASGTPPVGGQPASDQEFADRAQAPKPGAQQYSKMTPEGQRFWQADTRYSCAPPPWGELVAVNVNTGNIAWRSTLGAFDELEAKGLKTGTPNLGGGINTAGGLIFIGATVDGKFRAFDSKTGRELWSVKVDAPAHSVPATYLGKDGRQYVVVSAAGGGFLRDPVADAVVAFALPKGAVTRAPAKMVKSK